MYHILQELSGTKTTRKGTPLFPGPSPQSLERQDFEMIQNKKDTYWFCEKTDGVRYLLICLRYKGVNMALLMDRKCTDLYILPLQKFPRAAYQGSLFDGELAWNKCTGKFHFLIFDAVCVSGIPVWYLPLSHRIKCVSLCLSVYSPHHKDPILCSIKTFIDIKYKESCLALLEKAKQCYDIDGVVLSPEKDEVVYGRHSGMFKLKQKHTVDFIVHDDHGQLSIYNPQLKCQEVVASLALLAGQPLPPVGCVVECVYTGHDDAWSIVTVRKDKDTSNDRLTYDKTCFNMKEQLTLEEVFLRFSEM
jgi:hypothetical protein